MKCQTHPSVEAVAKCSVCEKPLCKVCDVSNEEAEALCSTCTALAAVSEFGDAEEHRAHAEQEKDLKKAKKSKSNPIVQYVIILVALVIVPYQFSSYIIPSSSVADVQLQLTDPEDITNECIYNLYLISDMLQAGQVPGPEIKCPASDDPYIVTVTANDTVVRDPHPELHGYIQMSVSRNNPEPLILE